MLVSGELQRHVRDVHTLEKCNFCDTYLYKHWTQEQRRAHFIGHHREILARWMDNPLDTEAEVIRGNGQELDDFYTERESRWHYCARCGRDHWVLNANLDRAYHDRVCWPRPKITEMPTDWKACRECGEGLGPESNTIGHTHRPDTPEGEAPFCEHCGLPLGKQTEAYRERHCSFCRGRGADLARFFPWCGVQLSSSVSDQQHHLKYCNSLPDPRVDGPINLATGDYFISRRRLQAEIPSTIAGEIHLQAVSQKRARVAEGKYLLGTMPPIAIASLTNRFR